MRVAGASIWFTVLYCLRFELHVVISASTNQSICYNENGSKESASDLNENLSKGSNQNNGYNEQDESDKEVVTAQKTYETVDDTPMRIIRNHRFRIEDDNFDEQSNVQSRNNNNDVFEEPEILFVEPIVLLIPENVTLDNENINTDSESPLVFSRTQVIPNNKADDSDSRSSIIKGDSRTSKSENDSTSVSLIINALRMVEDRNTEVDHDVEIVKEISDETEDDVGDSAVSDSIDGVYPDYGCGLILVRDDSYTEPKSAEPFLTVIPKSQ